MDISGISVSLTVVLSLVFGTGGALGVWFKLKGTVNIQAVQIETFKTEIAELKESHKEDKMALHKRIDSNKEIIERNRQNSDNAVSTMTTKMQEMELRIIKAIHEISK